MMKPKRLDPDAVALDVDTVARQLGTTPADVERSLRAAIAAGFLTVVAVHDDHVALQASLPPVGDVDG